MAIPQLYDVAHDEMRDITQADVDALMKIATVMAALPEVAIPNNPRFDFIFRLALYPNRMRPGRCFVAEAKEILPYPGVTGLNGKLLYPSIPDTPFAIRTDLPIEFATALISRWNSFIEKQTDKYAGQRED
jgi:hypothetical protein